MTAVNENQTPLSKIFRILIASGMVKDKTKIYLYDQGIIGYDVEQCLRFGPEVERLITLGILTIGKPKKMRK